MAEEPWFIKMIAIIKLKIVSSFKETLFFGDVFHITFSFVSKSFKEVSVVEE